LTRSHPNRRGDFSPSFDCGEPLRSKIRRPLCPRAAARVVPPATGVASQQQLLRAVPSAERHGNSFTGARQLLSSKARRRCEPHPSVDKERPATATATAAQLARGHARSHDESPARQGLAYVLDGSSSSSSYASSSSHSFIRRRVPSIDLSKHFAAAVGPSVLPVPFPSPRRGADTVCAGCCRNVRPVRWVSSLPPPHCCDCLVVTS
jgi:hypothetical protein